MAAPRSHGPLLEQPRRRALAVVAAVALLALAALLLRGPSREAPGSRPEAAREGDAWPIPGGDLPITAEVLNGTGRPRLARLGARLLREKGIDVISTGNADSHATTRIIARRGSRASAEVVQRALGIGAVDSVPDSLLRLDVTVVLGADFQPVTPLHP
ncbi:MAG: LytR C-terminal domain-containing protein [Gemmatimonadota bacterium]